MTEIDDLYGLPLEEFTSARNALAKELAKAKDPRADEVKQLQKPSVAAWAINQLVRWNRDDVRGLLEAGEQLRRAQEATLGGGDPGELREATRAQRKAVAQLTSQAERVLQQGGHAASVQTQNRVADTLRAAAVEDEARALLAAGRLARDLTPGSGFNTLAAMAPAAAPGKRERAADAEHPRKLQEAKREVAERKQELKAATKRAERAEAVARKARSQAEDAAAALRSAETALGDLET